MFLLFLSGRITFSMFLIGYTLLSSSHLAAIRGLGRDKRGVLHLCKCFSQCQQHRGAVPMTNVSTTAGKMLPQLCPASNTMRAPRCANSLSRSEAALCTSAHRKNSEILLAFTFPDIRAAWFHSLGLFVCLIIIILNVLNTNFCKEALQSSSNPQPMNSAFPSLSADADWQRSLLPLWCLKLVLAGVAINS